MADVQCDAFFAALQRDERRDAGLAFRGRGTEADFAHFDSARNRLAATIEDLLPAGNLDQRTRALYDDRHVFINGESFRAAGRDARLMRRLADDRALKASDVAALSEGASTLLDEWLVAGWVRASY